MIRNVVEEDAEDLCKIYNYYIDHTVISFEEKAVSIDQMQDRINKLIADGLPWLVYEAEVAGTQKVIGYAYASSWKTRIAYRFTLEATAYLAPDMGNQGIGGQLYQALFDKLETSFARSVMAVIALPNEASVRFHEKMGFEKVAHFKEVGFKREQWIDVGYWQKFL